MQTRPVYPVLNQTGSPFLNVAATCRGTRALGPGYRYVVWVQGCPLHCPGCIASDWLAQRPARLISPQALAADILGNSEIEGLTLSGGEPSAQAAALAELCRLVRARRELNIICFSGYPLEHLLTAADPAVGELLAEIDVLIDGPYQEKLNDNRGLRGSSNQRIHYLTSRLATFDFENHPRQMEVKVSSESVLFVGVPPIQLRQTVERAWMQASPYLQKETG